MEFRETNVGWRRGYMNTWIPSPFDLINKAVDFFRPRKLCHQALPSSRTIINTTTRNNTTTTCSTPLQNGAKITNGAKGSSVAVTESNGVKSSNGFAAGRSTASSSQTTSKSRRQRRKEVQTVTECSSITSSTLTSTFKLTAGSSDGTKGDHHEYSEQHFSHTSDALDVTQGQASSIQESSVRVKEERTGVRDRSTGPCPCFVLRTDPVLLRNFKPENHSEDCDITEARHMSTLHEDYTVISKQNNSLQREVDRLEASLALLEDTRMASPKHDNVTDVRVVLYGDLGAALNEGLPKNSVTESLYAVNVKLLERLEIEKKKVEEHNTHHDVIVSQLEQLVATVDSFQARFEEHMAEHRASLASSKHSEQSHEAHSSSVKVEPDVRNPQFWENLYADGHVSLAHDDVSLDLLDRKKSEDGITDPLPSQRLAKDDVEKDLTFELQSVVSDLRRVLQDMYDRDSQSIDQQKNVNSGRMSGLSSDRSAQEEKDLRGGLAGDLQAELEELRSDHALLDERYQSTVKRLHNTVQEKLLLESSAEKLKDELTIAQYEKESLLRKNERSLVQLNVIRDSLTDVELDRDSTIAEKNELTREIERLKLEMDVHLGQLRELDVLCRKVSAEKEGFLVELNSSSAQCGLLEKQLAIAGILSRNKSHQVTELEGRLEILNAERHLLLAESDALKDRNKNQQERLVQIENDLQSEHAKCAALMQSNERLHEDLRAKAEELDQSFRSGESFLQQKENLMQELQLITAKLEEQDDRAADLEKLATSTEDELLQAKRRLAELQATIDTHSREKDALLSKLGEMATEIEQMQGSSNDLKVLLTKKDDELVKVNTRLEVVQGEYEVIRSQKDVLRTENESLTRNCEELQSQLSQSDTTRQETARRLRDAEAFSEKLRSQLDVESLQLKQGLQQLDENRSLLIARTEELSQQLQTSYHQLSEYEVAQESLKKELTRRESELVIQKERHVESMRSCDVLREKLAGVLDDNCSLGNALMVLAKLVSGASGEELPSPGGSDNSSLQRRANDDEYGFENLLRDKVSRSASSKSLLFPEPPPSQVFEHDSGFVNGSHLDLTFPRREGTSLQSSSENSVTPMDDFEELVIHHDMVTVSDNLRKVQQAFLELNTRKAEGEALRQKVMSLEKQSLAQHERYEDVIKELQDSRHQSSLLNEKCNELMFNKETLSIAYQQGIKELRDQEVRTVELKQVLEKTQAEVERLTRFHVDESNNSSQLSARNLALSKELDETREQLRKVSSDLESSKRHVLESDQQSKELLDQLVSRNTEVERLTVALRNAESRAGSSEQLKLKEKTLHSLQREIEEKVNRTQEREMKLQDLDGRAAEIASMQASLSHREADLSARSQQLNERETALHAQEANLGAKLDQLLLSEEKLQVMMNDLEGRQVLRQELEDKHRLLENTYANLAASVGDLEGRLSRAETEKSAAELSRRELESAHSRFLAEADEAKGLLEKLLEERDSQINLLTKEKSDASEELRKIKSDNQALQDQIKSLTQEKLELEQNALNLPELRASLTEKTKLVATLTAEDKRLRQQLRNAESKLNAFQRTFEDLEERLQNKMHGKESLETQFNALNILYADTLMKYRALSDAHDELEIEILRNKDTNRDIRREMAKLSDFFRHHLLGGARTFTIRREDVPDLSNDASGTRSLITSLRASLEQYLEEQQVSATLTTNLFPPDTHSRPQSASSTGSLRSAPYSPAKGLFSGAEDDELELFRGKVMSKLFFSTSRENITRDELLSMQD
ncbi:hypothetical protein RvY_09169 [Ramazzottius varieornatus]|uniref:Uncharacterized protein n=1 Tax=Ramazzottius varieornatus TaxID=947166 RepID=A0A1D1V8I1_RAMVA|nr:hypothetical protein RvY_09169 [Ramazzottius varieornatus]